MFHSYLYIISRAGRMQQYARRLDLKQIEAIGNRQC